MECILITTEKERGMKKMKFLVLLSLVLVVSVLAMSGESFAAMNCSSCHGQGSGGALGTDCLLYTSDAADE